MREDVIIVGVGSSAGGLEALTELFEAARPDPRIAWVLVQHLSPDHRSFFPDILQRRTELPVRRAENLEVIEPGRVYVIEPSTQIRVAQGRIEATPWRRDRTEPARSVDTLFASLAEHHAGRSVAVVLSGSGSDGTEGAVKVARAGGLVIAQDPETAPFDSMPRSLIRTGVVDAVVQAHEIPGVIARWVPTVERSSPSREDLATERLVAVLSQGTGVDFSQYKREGIRRRAERRSRMLGIEDWVDYIDTIEEQPGEVEALQQDLLIGVTSFFRDPDAWHAFRTQLVNEIQRDEKEVYRVWCVGCSTGEEAYSMAMMIEDVLADLAPGRSFKLFATDLNERAVNFATRGRYSETQVEGVPSEMLGRYFVREPDGYYKVRPFLRESMLFSRHDLIHEPPFSRMDVVSCRNLMIYLTPSAQERALDRLRFSLSSGGLLFLGSSEAAVGTHWTHLDSRYRLYRAVGAPPIGRQPLRLMPTRVQSPTRRTASAAELGPLHRAITQGTVPPHLVTSPDLRLLFRSGDLGGLVQLPDGPITTDIRRMVPPDLSVLLGLAADRLLDPAAEHTEVIYEGVSEVNAHGSVHFDLLVRRVHLEGEGDMLVFLFQGLTEGVPRNPEVYRAAAIDASLRDRVGQLEEQLENSQVRLQATVEQLESSNEELQATNEELLASNEELQSVNEELQSVNEELHTVNEEHQIKLEEMSLIRRELEQLLDAIDVGVLRLDANLVIRRLNARMEALSALREGDVGRPLVDLSDRVVGVSILALCRRVEALGQPLTQSARYEGRAYLFQAHPLMLGGVTQGVIITCADITAAELYAAVEARLATAMSATGVPMAVEDEASTLVFANEAFAAVLHREARWIADTRFDDLLAEPREAERIREHLRESPTWTGVLVVLIGKTGPQPIAVSAYASVLQGTMQGVVWQIDLPSRVAAVDRGELGTLAYDPRTRELWLGANARGLLGIAADRESPLSSADLDRRLTGLATVLGECSDTGASAEWVQDVPDGGEVHVWVHRRAFSDEEDGLLGVVWHVP